MLPQIPPEPSMLPEVDVTDLGEDLIMLLESSHSYPDAPS